MNKTKLSLDFIGATAREKLVSRHRVVNEGNSCYNECRIETVALTHEHFFRGYTVAREMQMHEGRMEDACKMHERGMKEARKMHARCMQDA